MMSKIASIDFHNVIIMSFFKITNGGIGKKSYCIGGSPSSNLSRGRLPPLHSVVTSSPNLCSVQCLKHWNVASVDVSIETGSNFLKTSCRNGTEMAHQSCFATALIREAGSIFHSTDLGKQLASHNPTHRPPPERLDDTSKRKLLRLKLL